MGQVAVVEFAHAETRNLLNLASIAELRAVFDALAKIPALSAVVLAGDFGVFCRGSELVDDASGRSVDEEFEALTARLEQFAKPIVGAITGDAIDEGFELALCCHALVASERALFAIDRTLAEPARAARIVLLLAHCIPPKKALATCLLGLPIFAQEALLLGFVNQLTNRFEVTSRAVAWATRMGSADRRALHHTLLEAAIG